jgi:hypothetical protein
VRRVLELTATLVEVCRVLPILSRIELARSRQSPLRLLSRLRQQARRTPRRRSRVCLQRAIRWVDARMAGGGNCYRRALLEVALDRGAAAEPLLLGFDMIDKRLAGHAWLPGSEQAGTYHFTVRL